MCQKAQDIKTGRRLVHDQVSLRPVQMERLSGKVDERDDWKQMGLRIY